MNSVLALKSYSEWKQTGGNGVWKFGGNVKPTISTKSFVRKNSEPFMNSLARNSSMNDKSLNALSTDLDQNKMVGKLNCFKFVPLLALSILKVKIFLFPYASMQSTSGSLSMLVRAVLLDKKPEEVPTVRHLCTFRCLLNYWT